MTPRVVIMVSKIVGSLEMQEIRFPSFSRKPVTKHNPIILPSRQSPQKGDNPWIQTPQRAKLPSKIIGMTPIGTVSIVPTATIRPPPTPRRIVCPPSKSRSSPNAIRADVTKSASPMKITHKFGSKLLSLSVPIGFCDKPEFDKAMAIYENNQVFYQKVLDTNQGYRDIIKRGLTKLEHWFICIIEPMDKENVSSWRERERSKLRTGKSPHCDPELYPYIEPLTTEVRMFLKKHRNL